jgi:hypothetical protein
MYHKATRQIELGETKPPYAYIVQSEQHDRITAFDFLRKLHMADVEVHSAKKQFNYDGVTYPKGTHVIFTAQTCRAYILKLLRETYYHDGPHTRSQDDTPLSPYDLSTDTMAEFMGVNIVEVIEPLSGSFERCESVDLPKGNVEESKGGYLLDGRLNTSYTAVNELLKDGKNVYKVLEKVGNRSIGAFYIPTQSGIKKKLEDLVGKYHVTFQVAERDDFQKKPVKPLIIGVYQRYRGGNIDEGWTRWVLEQHSFEYTTLMDKRIKEGDLVKNFDAIIIPNDDRRIIVGKEKEIEEYYTKRRPKSVVPKYPEEYRSGLGEEGVGKLKEFVEVGGTLLTFGKASELVIEDLKLPFLNVLKDVKPKDFHCPGSTLKVNVNTYSPLAHGVSEDLLLLFKDYPAFQVRQTPSNEDYTIVLSYPEERMLKSGWIIGEKHLSNKAALIDAKHGKGRVILYGFSPLMRGITAATYKLLFNALLE